MEILSRRTAAPAHRPQGTPLTQIPTEFSSQPEGTELSSFSKLFPRNEKAGMPQTRANNFKIWMKMQKTLKSQSNLKKEEKTLSIMFPDLHCYTKL